MDTSLQLDQTDRAILKHLQSHAKLTNVQLAEEIGLSPASTLERVRKLENKGIIKSYHARLAPEKLALHAQLIVQVKLQHITADNIAAFQKAIEAIPEIVACYQVLGNVDFVLKIVTKDIAAYQQLVMHQLSTVANIRSLTPLIITATSKASGIPLA